MKFKNYSISFSLLQEKSALYYVFLLLKLILSVKHALRAFMHATRLVDVQCIIVGTYKCTRTLYM